MAWEHFTLDRAEFELSGEYFPPTMLGSYKHSETVQSTEKISSEDGLPKISVVIPLYNTEKYIEECLTSLLDQTMQDFEVIVVDDCSTDRSAAIVDGMRDKFGDRLTLIRLKKNNGEPGTPRNIGIKFAVGKYLYFVDSDDILMPESLNVLYTTAEQMNTEVVHVMRRYDFHQEKTFSDIINGVIAYRTKRENKPPLFEQCDLERRIVRFYKINFAIEPWNFFVKRSFIISNMIDFAPTFLFDDTFFAFCCTCCSNVYVRIYDVLYARRHRESSIISFEYDVASHICSNIVSLNLVFQRSDKNFFAEHLYHNYVAHEYFFRRLLRVLSYVRRYYNSNAPSALFAFAEKILPDKMNFNACLIAYCFSNANIQSEEIAERDRRIKQLRAKLEQLKADQTNQAEQTKNPAK